MRHLRARFPWRALGGRRIGQANGEGDPEHRCNTSEAGLPRFRRENRRRAMAHASAYAGAAEASPRGAPGDKWGERLLRAVWRGIACAAAPRRARSLELLGPSDRNSCASVQGDRDGHARSRSKPRQLSEIQLPTVFRRRGWAHGRARHPRCLPSWDGATAQLRLYNSPSRDQIACRSSLFLVPTLPAMV